MLALTTIWNSPLSNVHASFSVFAYPMSNLALLVTSPQHETDKTGRLHLHKHDCVTLDQETTHTVLSGV